MSSKDKFETPIEGGESKKELADKAMALFQEIYQQHQTPIVVVASNNTLEALTALLNKENPYEKIPVDYSGILQLQRSGDELKIVKIHHLA